MKTAISRWGIRKNLDLLPEPWRSQLRDGDWTAGSRDDDWQVIPTARVDAVVESHRR